MLNILGHFWIQYLIFGSLIVTKTQFNVIFPYMCGSRNFRRVPRSICHRKKCVFVVTLSLFFVVFYSSFLYFTKVRLFNFKVDYNFLRLQRGSNLFRGEGGGSICLFPIENHITCDFQGVWTPSSHLD